MIVFLDGTLTGSGSFHGTNGASGGYRYSPSGDPTKEPGQAFLNRSWGGYFTHLFDAAIQLKLTSPPDAHERLGECLSVSGSFDMGRLEFLCVLPGAYVLLGCRNGSPLFPD